MRRLFVLLLSLSATPALAQDMGWSTITPSITGTDTLGLALRGDFGNSDSAPDPSMDQRPAPTAKARAVDPVTFAYEPSLSRSSKRSVAR